MNQEHPILGDVMIHRPNGKIISVDYWDFCAVLDIVLESRSRKVKTPHLICAGEIRQHLQEEWEKWERTTP